MSMTTTYKHLSFVTYTSVTPVISICSNYLYVTDTQLPVINHLVQVHSAQCIVHSAARTCLYVPQTLSNTSNEHLSCKHIIISISTYLSQAPVAPYQAHVNSMLLPLSPPNTKCYKLQTVPMPPVQTVIYICTAV